MSVEAPPAAGAAAPLRAGGVPDALIAALAAAVERALGDGAGAQLAEDPWLLLEVPWVKPEQADAFARGALGDGARPDDPRRRRALVTWLLRRAALEGHTTLAAATVLGALPGLGVADAEAALASVVAEDAVLAVDGSDGLHVALERYASAEDAVAESVARLVATARHLAAPDVLARLTAAPTDGAVDVTAAVRAAATAGVSVAVVRTPIAAAHAVAALAGLAGAAGVPMCLVAPTARAARAWRASGAVDAGVAITTVAGLPDRPPTRGLVVVTEAAVLDAETAAALLEALPDGTHVTLVGDPGGLAGPGPGDVLADLAACAELPSHVVAGPSAGPGSVLAGLAAGIAAGALPEPDAGREVVLVPARDDGEAAHRVVQLVTDSIPRALGIAADDVLVVTPRRGGAVGADALDARLRSALGLAPGDLAPGARVVATDPARGHPAYGEPGIVRGIEDDEVVLDVAGSEVRLPVESASLRPARALTPREALGTTWPAVVLVLPGEAAESLSRDLLATAVGRATKHLSVVHAAGPALPAAVGRSRKTRTTRLPALLAELLG